MSQTSLPSDKSVNNPAANELIPPDERFWQRYSPHGELPLSSAGSFVVHILAFGLLLLVSFLGTMLFQPNRSLPVDAVQLSGGGGNPHGEGDGPNTGEQPVEAGAQAKERKAEDLPPDNTPDANPKIDPVPQTKPSFDEPPSRQIPLADTKASNAFQNLRVRAGQIQSPGSRSGPGFGRGGTGKGGGSGGGAGKGIGNGVGVGPPVNLTEREKKQIRWRLLINTDANKPADYVDKLRGLGAVLSFPVGENGDSFKYTIVPLSNRQNDKQKASAGDIEAMFPVCDHDPKSARRVMKQLGFPLPQIAEEKLHFVAYLPQELENKLSRLEREYLQRKYPSRTKDEITETEFIIRFRNGKHEPEVERMKFGQ